MLLVSMRALPVVFVLLFVTSAHALDDDDGLYGRFDGDVWLSATLYGASRIAADEAHGVGALEFRARYLDSAGFFVTAELVSAHLGIAAGVDLRPLFLARFLTGRSIAIRFWDLLIDSIGIDLGVRLRPEQRDVASLIVGTGVDVPCYVGDALRLFARAGFRYGLTPDASAPTERDDFTIYGGLVFETHARIGATRHEP